MFRILIDTCVWLDLARDYQQRAILAALEELIRQKDVELLLPRTIIDEFARNKSRIVDESGRSLSSTMKRVKEAVEKFGDPRKKGLVLSQLNDVDHRLPILGEASWALGRREPGSGLRSCDSQSTKLLVTAYGHVGLEFKLRPFSASSILTFRNKIKPLASTTSLAGPNATENTINKTHAINNCAGKTGDPHHPRTVCASHTFELDIAHDRFVGPPRTCR